MSAVRRPKRCRGWFRVGQGPQKQTHTVIHTWRFGNGLCGPCAAALEWHDGEYATSGPEHNLATRGGKYVKVYACDWGQGGRGWGGGGGWWQLTMATLTSTPPSKAASTPATSPVLAQSISASWHTKRGVEPCSHLPKARADTMDTQRPTMCPIVCHRWRLGPFSLRRKCVSFPGPGAAISTVLRIENAGMGARHHMHGLGGFRRPAWRCER